MSNHAARRVLAIGRVGETSGIAMICGGIAALYWNGVRYCGGGLRQLFWPEQVTFGDGRVQAYVPNCPGNEVHTLAIGIGLLVVGAVCFLGARWLFAAANLRTLKATTLAVLGIALAMLGIGIIPVENYAVGDMIESTGHAVRLWSRVSRVPGALLAVGGTVMAVLALRRRLR